MDGSQTLPKSSKGQRRILILPLHWATVKNNIRPMKLMKNRKGTGKIIPKAVIELLLEVYTDGAHYPDNLGTLPLALLLDREYQEWTFDDSTYRCAMALVKCAPDALTQPDKKYHSLLFMMAAFIKESNYRHTE